ncbi:MAG: PilZ domain-containing protein [Devosiaceae bacterium]|nr:PilZ domain-containing protein [Devosiaceae bacterium MH13]
MNAQRLAVATSIAADRRRHQRVEVDLLGRFMMPNLQEYPCQVTDMSPGGAALISPVAANIGDRIIAYIDHIGRIEGKVSRLIDGGFAMTIQTSSRRRDKLAAQLTYLANKDLLNLPEDRRHERQVVENPFNKLVMSDGREYPCSVLDISLSGAAVRTKVRPSLGTVVHLGNMRARVVRHIDEGIALEFIVVQTEETLGADT